MATETSLLLNKNNCPSSSVGETLPTTTAKYSHLGKPLSSWDKIALLIAQPTIWSSEAIIRAKCTTTQPGIWGNYDTEFVERLRRIGIIYGNFAFDHLEYFHPRANLWGLSGLNMITHYASGIVSAIGDFIDHKDYTYFAGNLSESHKNISNPKLLTLNACMYWGGQTIPQGGVQPARYRIQPFCDKVSEVNPDILVCQEVSLDPAIKLIDTLKDNYAHFYANIGPYPFWIESGLFVASKLPIVSAPQFHPFPNQPLQRRGFFYFETPKFWVVTTHLNPSNTDIRRDQLTQITDKIDELQKTTDKPCIFLGDLNIGYSSDEKSEYTSSGLRNMYVNNFEKGLKTEKTNSNPFVLSPQNATWTGLLDVYTGATDVYMVNGKRVDWEVDDYALYRKGQEDKFSKFDVELLNTYKLDENDQLADPGNAVTDHRGIILRCNLTDQPKEL